MVYPVSFVYKWKHVVSVPSPVPKIIGGVTNLVTNSKMILYKPYHVSIVS